MQVNILWICNLLMTADQINFNLRVSLDHKVLWACQVKSTSFISFRTLYISTIIEINTGTKGERGPLGLKGEQGASGAQGKD